MTTISNNNSTYEKGKLVVRVAAAASVAFVIVPILGKVMVVPRVIIAAVVAVIALTAVILMVISEMVVILRCCVYQEGLGLKVKAGACGASRNRQTG